MRRRQDRSEPMIDLVRIEEHHRHMRALERIVRLREGLGSVAGEPPTRGTTAISA
jgi:hypothetical protein